MKSDPTFNLNVTTSVFPLILSSSRIFFPKNIAYFFKIYPNQNLLPIPTFSSTYYYCVFLHAKQSRLSFSSSSISTTKHIQLICCDIWIVFLSLILQEHAIFS